jgi:FkbM family methyltransferase
MKVYIDLGAFTGETIAKAIEVFDDVDLFIAIEPIPKLCKRLRERFAGNNKVKILECAVGDRNCDIKLYIGTNKRTGKLGSGSSLFMSKVTGNISEDNYILTRMIDFSKYLSNHFDIENDEIILKLNIEGEEYVVLRNLIATGNIKYIKKIYCQWHHHKVKMFHDVHDKLISDLRDYGYDLTGTKNDDFAVIYKLQMRVILWVILACKKLAV